MPVSESKTVRISLSRSGRLAGYMTFFDIDFGFCNVKRNVTDTGTPADAGSHETIRPRASSEMRLLQAARSAPFECVRITAPVFGWRKAFMEPFGIGVPWTQNETDIMPLLPSSML